MCEWLGLMSTLPADGQRVRVLAVRGGRGREGGRVPAGTVDDVERLY